MTIAPRPLTRQRLVHLLVVAGAVALAGCSSSPWRSEFRAAEAGGAFVGGAADRSAPVRIREVPWERVQSTLSRLNAERAASDIHPDDWEAPRKEAARAELLRGLQVSEDPRSVTILGRADFRTTDRVPRPQEDPELAAFARQIGATTVIWTSSYLGKADVVRSEPVTEWRSGSWDRWGGGGGSYGGNRSRSFSESSTIWVPVVVSADERAFVAYFLRESSGQALR